MRTPHAVFIIERVTSQERTYVHAFLTLERTDVIADVFHPRACASFVTVWIQPTLVEPDSVWIVVVRLLSEPTSRLKYLSAVELSKGHALHFFCSIHGMFENKPPLTPHVPHLASGLWTWGTGPEHGSTTVLRSQPVQVAPPLCGMLCCAPSWKGSTGEAPHGHYTTRETTWRNNMAETDFFALLPHPLELCVSKKKKSDM